MSFFKDWATSFWFMAKFPAFMFSVLVVSYWVAAGLFKAATYLYDAGVSFWVVPAILILCFTVLGSLVMTVSIRRQK